MNGEIVMGNVLNGISRPNAGGTAQHSTAQHSTARNTSNLPEQNRVSPALGRAPQFKEPQA
jgi:hypothetical protein